MPRRGYRRRRRRPLLARPPRPGAAWARPHRPEPEGGRPGRALQPRAARPLLAPRAVEAPRAVAARRAVPAPRRGWAPWRPSAAHRRPAGRSARRSAPGPPARARHGGSGGRQPPGQGLPCTLSRAVPGRIATIGAGQDDVESPLVPRQEVPTSSNSMPSSSIGTNRLRRQKSGAAKRLLRGAGRARSSRRCAAGPRPAGRACQSGRA